MIRKIAVSAIAASSLLLYAIASPVYAATTLEISGNGSSSESEATVNADNTNTVVQSNTAEITNSVHVDASTGGNDANNNTGGDVVVSTGDASSRVDIANQVNANVADVTNCNNCNTDQTVTISGNGTNSDNDATVNANNATSVFQENTANINNHVSSDTNTGWNDANGNTGGDVTVLTGDATSRVNIVNQANANLATVGGNGNGEEQGTVDARITGNGSDSENEIELNLDRETTLVQDNYASIRNDVYAKAQTGKNDANDNTNGDVLIFTGDARTTVGIDNMANFNYANVDCCLTDVLAKISGNGTDSENEITANMNNLLSVFQGEEKGNLADLNNWIGGYSKTGYNDAEDNTGPAIGDPTDVITGDATFTTEISNEANANYYGPLAGLEFPGSLNLPGGVSLDLHFDLGDLMSLLHVV